MYQIYNKPIKLKSRRHKHLLENIEDYLDNRIVDGLFLKDKSTEKIHELYLNNSRIFTIERPDLTGEIDD